MVFVTILGTVTVGIRRAHGQAQLVFVFVIHAVAVAVVILGKAGLQGVVFILVRNEVAVMVFIPVGDTVAVGVSLVDQCPRLAFVAVVLAVVVGVLIPGVAAQARFLQVDPPPTAVRDRASPRAAYPVRMVLRMERLLC